MSTATEWRTYRTCELIDQKLLAIGDGYRAKNSELDKTGIPFARAGNINGGFNFDETDLFPKSDLRKVGEKISRPGDVVFTSKGTVGRFAFVREATPIFVYSPQLCYWRSLAPDMIDPRYLFYWMQGGEFWLQADGVKGQTDMADYVSLGDQRRMFITLPSPNEQRAIASILGTLDDKIELNRRMNRTLEDIAQAIFKSWFVDFDPVIAKREDHKPVGMDDTTAALFPAHFQETDMGPIPAGWKEGSTADIARYVNGKNFTKNASGTGRMVIRIAELNSGPAGSTIYNDVKANQDNVAFPNNLLFSWSGSLDVYRWHRDAALVNQHIFKVVCEKYPQWFVYYHLQDAMTFFQGIAADKATTMGHIKREHLSQFDVALPPAELINTANRIIRPIYDRIHRNERQMLSLAALRDTLLPQLLSGELRIGNSEKMIGEA